MIFLCKFLFCILTAGVTICLDPGHGGTSTGALGEYIDEKDVVLDVALRLQNWLTQVPGISFVALTRTGDYNVSLQARTDYANSWGFDYFVSLHENAFNGAVQGTETFCYSLDPDDESYQLALPVQSSLIAAYGYTDRGVKVGDYLHVIRETEMPAILGEGSFLDYDVSWNESYLYAYNIEDHAGLQAWAYADGICEYLGLEVPFYDNAVILIDNLSVGFSVNDSLAWSDNSIGNTWMLNSMVAEAAPGRIATFESVMPVYGQFFVQAWWTVGFNRSSSVCYRVIHADGFTDIFVNQFASGGGSWVPLGSFTFNGNCSIQILGDNSSSGVMVADAVKLVPPLGVEEDIPAEISVLSNPASSFTVVLPSTTSCEVLIVNSAGRVVDSLSGVGSVEWMPVDLPQGVYFAVEPESKQSVKLVLLN